MLKTQIDYDKICRKTLYDDDDLPLHHLRLIKS